MSCSIFVLAFLTMGRSPGSSDSKKNKKTKTHPQCRRPGFNPRVGKIPWKGEWLPTLVFLPGEFHGLYSPQGHKKSDTTEWISHFSFSLTIPFLTSPFIKLFVVKHFGVHHLFPAKTLPTTNWCLPRACANCLCGDWIPCRCSCSPSTRPGKEFRVETEVLCVPGKLVEQVLRWLDIFRGWFHNPILASPHI